MKKQKPKKKPARFSSDEFDEFDPYTPSVEEQIEELEQDKHEAAYAEIDRRRHAYSRVFAGKGAPGDIDIVMRDLAWFCRFHSTPFHADQRVHALLSGRHEVMQRIVDFSRLDRDALFRKYNGSQ